MNRKAFLLHPVLFSVYFVLYFWSKNLSVSFSEVRPLLFFFLCFSTAVILVLGFVLKNFKKAGLEVTFFFVWFFSYGHVRDVLGSSKLFGIEIGRHTYLMMIWALIFVIMAIGIIMLRREKIVNGLTNYLNATSLILMFFVLFPIATFQIKHAVPKKEAVILKKAAVHSAGPVRLSPQIRNNSLPDIYYIILDSYMNSDVLKSELGFDNGKFCEKLQKKGFFVSSSSRSNYVWTFLSITSTLNFRYLDSSKDKDVRGELTYNNKAAEILKEKGYKIISIGGMAINADLRYEYGPARNFIPSLIDRTWAYPLTFFGLLNSAIYEYQRKCILYAFDRLGEIPNIKEPTFTFVHIENPHIPYIFNREGKPLSFNLSGFDDLKNNKKKGDLWHKKECLIYVEQIIFLNKKVEILVDKILSSSPDSIIIIAGDHGQFLGLADSPSPKLFKLRTSMFNAYYLPNVKGNPLYHGISPVNSFRIIFNLYFDGRYELLPDAAYWSPMNDLWNFVTVEKV